VVLSSDPIGAGSLLSSFELKKEADAASEKLCGRPSLRRRTKSKISVTATLNRKCSGAVGGNTALQTKRLRVRF
jgi:hypothetical protein